MKNWRHYKSNMSKLSATHHWRLFSHLGGRTMLVCHVDVIVFCVGVVSFCKEFLSVYEHLWVFVGFVSICEYLWEFFVLKNFVVVYLFIYYTIELTLPMRRQWSDWSIGSRVIFVCSAVAVAKIIHTQMAKYISLFWGYFRFSHRILLCL